MLIVTHGSVVRFECKCCGCVFITGTKECECRSPYQCYCPECGILVMDGELVVSTTKKVDNNG